MPDPNIRCGDHVHHTPSGEDWVVAWADYSTGDLAWCGWPDGTARLVDCTVIRRATDEEHAKLAHKIASGPSRARANGVRRLYPELFAKAAHDEAETGRPMSREMAAVVSMSCAGDLDPVGVDKLTAMVEAVRRAGLTDEAKAFETVLWAWYRIAQSYVCAHPYVRTPEKPSMTPISALTVVDSTLAHWGALIPGTPKLDDERVLQEAAADEAWHHEEERRMRRDAGEDI